MATGNPDGISRLRRAQESGARRSGARAMIFLLVAIAAAVVAAVVFTHYVDARIQGARVPTTPVVVADVDLPLGTVLADTMVKVTQWPNSSLPDGTSETVEELLGRVVLTQLRRNEPVTNIKLASEEAGAGLAAVLPPGMLAVSVRVDDVVGVAGFVHPGDKVDVIVTMRPTEDANTPYVSKVILQNIQILAVGKQIDREIKKVREPLPATVATLMVTPDEAERLALAASRGKLLLGLRSSLFGEEVETTGAMPQTMLTTRRPRRTSTPARTTEKPEETPEADVVEILRGNLFEKRRFEEKGNQR